MAILAAMRRSTGAVRLYFIAQLIATPVLFVGVRVLGNHADYYSLLYCAVTLPILETSWFIAAGRGVFTALPSATVAALIGGIALASLTSLSRDTIIVLIEGTLLCFIGWALLLGAPNLTDYTAAKGIGTLSILLSTFDFGYILHADWETANRWVPSFLGIATFLWLGRQPNEQRVGHRLAA